MPTGITIDFISLPNTDWVVLAKGNTISVSKDFCSSWMFVNAYSGNFGCGDGKDTNSIYFGYSNGSVLKYNIFTIGIIKISNEVPNGFKLSQNYPNPFNPETNIEFAIPTNSNIKLTIYDASGREIAVLANRKLEAGTYKVNWNADNLPSGVYFYKLQSEKYFETKKMVLVK